MAESSAGIEIRRSARHQIRETMVQSILTGEYLSGTKLKQIALAKQFGVGQGVVREALIELKNIGLVETIDNRGIFVTQLNAKKLFNSIEVRMAIEGTAVRLCCDRCSQADVRTLQSIVRQIYDHFKSGSTEEGAAMDREFHHELVRLSGNSELLRITDTYRAFGKIVQLDRAPKTVYGEHRAILKAIEKKQPDDADRLTREHLEAGKTLLEKRLRQDPNFLPHWVV